MEEKEYINSTSVNNLLNCISKELTRFKKKYKIKNRNDWENIKKLLEFTSKLEHHKFKLMMEMKEIQEMDEYILKINMISQSFELEFMEMIENLFEKANKNLF